jgi:hypothetical protein
MGSLLEPLALRSTLPTGRVTLRYPTPTLLTAFPEAVRHLRTTPKVPEVVLQASDRETAARKGGEAR